MALLRAEQIVAAVNTTVTGLTTTKQNTRVNPVYTQEPDNLPALDIFQGDDVNLSELGATNVSFVDNDLSIIFRAYVRKNNNYVVNLNLIRKEIHIALMADHTQGLSFVITTIPQSAGTPVLEFGDKPISTMDMSFIFRYRHSITDPSA